MIKNLIKSWAHVLSQKFIIKFYMLLRICRIISHVTFMDKMRAIVVAEALRFEKIYAEYKQGLGK